MTRHCDCQIHVDLHRPAKDMVDGERIGGLAEQKLPQLMPYQHDDCCCDDQADCAAAT